MSDFQNEMNHTVQGFVAQITELARRAAITTLESAFNGDPSSSRKSSNGSHSRRATVAPVVAGASRAGRPQGRGAAKRTAADLELLSEKFTSFVHANPGLRIEQINKALGTTTRALALPIRKLIADRLISAKGHKRSTTYFTGKKAKN